jgi:hypothetical protein
MSEEQNRFWQLVHPGAPRGLVCKEPEFREQDAEALPVEGYAVIFFPKISGLGRATMAFYSAERTFSQTPEAAITKFLDGLSKGQTWETYADAGHKVRRVKMIDLGDPEPSP